MPGSRWVALLRGVNVAGKHKLPMAALAALFEELGCAGVETWIQSGNVVFAASAAQARRIPARAQAALAARHGLDVPVVVRSARELGAVVAGNPFLREGAPPAALHVAFLAERPAAAQVAALDPARSPPDRFAVVGREVYLCCPGGIGRSKLTTAWLDARLATTSTVRNWNTVLALHELVGA